mgnify:CR=1 FL=1
MGTPEFAVASLRRIVADGHEVCGVFTQPDKPKNRGHKLMFSPVKEYALTENIPVYQPLKARDGEAMALVESLAPELIVVAAYGKILPEELLNYPKYGSINVHSSLLPKYRGAAPINWAILNGETETGVSIMYMAKDLDAGDVIRQAVTPIRDDEDAQALTARLADLGAETLSQVIRDMEAGKVSRTPQDHSAQTYAPMLSKELSAVDWSRSAHAIHCQIRGLIPWPCASTDIISGQPMKLFAAKETGEETTAAPGRVIRADKRGICVACGDGKVLCLTELQAPGGKRMSAASYLAGHPISLGDE